LRFDWTSPVLIDERSNIVAGHGRYLAAVSLGLKQVPVISVSGLSEAELRALALADNKSAANAGWDRPMLAAEIADLAALLPDCGLDLAITGFDTAEIDPLMGDVLDPEDSPADSFPQPDGSNPITRNGDIWLLGKHRLMCGDACDPADIRS
jgi:ParB-like chromosome segregation protein Spo0J